MIRISLGVPSFEKVNDISRVVAWGSYAVVMVTSFDIDLQVHPQSERVLSGSSGLMERSTHAHCKVYRQVKYETQCLNCLPFFLS
jgi:hypothetical protein